jgi:uncharacterized protein (UPF0332 family)
VREDTAGWLGRARTSIEVARSLAEDGYYADAVSKAYYAMFYAAKSLSAGQGQDLAKHSAVIAAFGHDFVATGQLGRELHRYIREAFAQRNEADYGWAVHAAVEDAASQIAHAEEFVAAVEDYLKESGG